MEVVRRCQVLFFFCFILTACSQDKTAESIFVDGKAQCGADAIANRFLVNWVDGRITVESGADKKTFLKEFVEPNLDKIALVEHDYTVRIDETVVSSDVQTSAVADNWGASNVNVASVWQNNIRGDGIIVAVVDSGVSIEHNQLVSQIAYNKGESGTDSLGRDKRTNGIDDDQNGFIDDWTGFDFSRNETSILDNNEHGTHVSGIIAAEHHDSQIKSGYVQGVAPEAKILPATFIGTSGYGEISNAIRAIDYAVKRGARVINASWGGAPCSQSLKQKMASLESQGVMMIVASGNSGQNIDQFAEYPAAFNLPNQITVGAIGYFNGMASFSNYGDRGVHIFAPGVDIVSTIPNNKIAAMDGTSMATPFVAGAVALLLSHRPTASAAQIRTALYYRDPSVTPANPFYRNASQGRLNIASAIRTLESLIP